MVAIVSQKNMNYVEIYNKGVRLFIKPPKEICDGITLVPQMAVMYANLMLAKKPENCIFTETTYDDGTVTYKMPSYPELEIMKLKN